MGDKAEISIECSGATPCVQTAIYVTEPGGCVVLVGCCQKVIDLPVMAASLREVDIRGNLRYCNCYPTALEMVASGKVDVKPLITHRFSLEDSIKAFETTLRGEGIKAMIDCAR
ncbi:sorbitol dehydrogenase-like [Mizuhopecten yessoensis]|nr:sorbitol dehydrogenase-like [Mizuhopecten yessoensis]